MAGVLSGSIGIFYHKEKVQTTMWKLPLTIHFGMPMGERIIVNDRKPSGLGMAIAININRDDFRMPKISCEL